MATWFRKAMNVTANCLKAKTGSWGFLNQRHLSLCFHSNFSSPASLNGRNYRNPSSFLGNSTALSGSCRRFDSAKAGRQEELQYDNGGDQDQREMGSILVRVHNKRLWSSSLHHLTKPYAFHRSLGPLSNHPTPIISSLPRFESTKSQNQLLQDYYQEIQALDFPGGAVPFTPEMRFISGASRERIPCYRVLDDNGNLIRHSSFVQVNKEDAVKMYSSMVTLQTMDTIFYEAQRQGRISFYVTSIGEEAINISSAAALTPEDVILPQYREPGVLLWRGFTLQEFANQCLGNKSDYGKGRQMPIHYGSNKHNYFTISSPIATQLPQAVGAAYSLKMDGKDACVVTYFGDGGSSEGDFHAALNFAAVMEAPVIFICRNNGWAISTPTSEQFRSDGIVVKGQAYGIQSIRVDGNDALAVYSATHAAREMAITEQRPILIEALTYRVGHHSTSDDSTKYRPVDEIDHWKMSRNPVARFRRWVDGNGWWNDEDESELRGNVRKQLMHAIQVAEKVEKPPLSDLFTDVYENMPSNLVEQEELLRQSIRRHPQDYPSDVPL